ncbi:MAG: APC family permease [Acidimicrobiales bacterium]|jgi:amino acid transporter
MTATEVPAPSGAPAASADQAATLRPDELNLFDATVVAVASVAPAYSLAATLSLLFVAVAYAGPAVIIVSFIPVLFIAVAYFYLNRRDPNCGACYAWLSKLVSPSVGWFGGWVQVAASVLFCVAAPILAGGYTLQFMHTVGWISASTADNTWLTVVVGAVWLAVITFITIYGIRWTANTQWFFLLVQYAALLGSSIWGIVKVAADHPVGSTGFRWAWIDPLSISGYKGLAVGSVLGLFFFWGWDTAVNLNEESKNSTKVPGQAGILSMFLLLFIFVLNVVAAQMLLPAKEFSRQGANVLFYFAERVGGPWMGYLMIIAVLSSTVADTQTTLLPAARVTLSMARDGVFPRVFGIINGKFQTPMIGTLILAFVAQLGILLRAGSPTISSVYGNLIDNIGVLVAFYYGATGLTCAWSYRAVMFKKTSFFFTGILLPFLSGVFCFWVGYEVVRQAGLVASAPVLVAYALGVPLVIVARQSSTSDFFAKHPIAYDSIN